MGAIVEAREFRNALGRFPTSVAVVVARDDDGTLVGLTVNSVAPVAIDPPRLAWSLGVRSRSRAVFESAPFFAVNVLKDDQLELAQRMAAAVPDRFAGLAWRESSASRLPFFDGCVARFDCWRTATLELGDHVMFLGDIIDFETEDGAPLLYYQGRYAQLRG